MSGIVTARTIIEQKSVASVGEEAIHDKPWVCAGLCKFDHPESYIRSRIAHININSIVNRGRLKSVQSSMLEAATISLTHIRSNQILLCGSGAAR